MGLWNFLLNLVLGGYSGDDQTFTPEKRPPRPEKEPPKKIRLEPLRYRSHARRMRPEEEINRSSTPPYTFAHKSHRTGGYLDLSLDGHEETLNSLGLPVFHTPQQLADWLRLPVGRVAWLTDRFHADGRPGTEAESHYCYCWKQKRSGGYRLIETPKQMLRAVQDKILAEILERVAVHANCHGFTPGRSIVTNATPHVGQHVVIKIDLENFYGRIRTSRVVATYRSMGYSREVAIWLAKLTTSAVPTNLKTPRMHSYLLHPYLARHVPQGAPTSPALANLVSYALDVRLTGMAKTFNANYTRYADDLTFSGDDRFARSLKTFLPLVQRIISSERFRTNGYKRKVLKQNIQQSVTGVVVNKRTNISRKEFDRLKATLTNCVRYGPDSQNRNDHPNFSAHLRGRIAHVQQLNPRKAERLLRLYHQISW